MVYDLLIKDGRIIDGSGLPSFCGDVGVVRGKIFEIGRLRGPAKRTIDARGLAVAPGFIDNHCHYDAQVTWDPLCTFSCHHGATSVIIGNCSLTLAPAKPKDRSKVLGMLSQVEAIPMDILQAGVQWRWETIPEYMEAIEQRLGVNVGMLMGHSPIRFYAMGEASQERPATESELALMRDIVREGLEAGALGLSVTRNMSHFDVEGKRIPAAVAPEEELIALAKVLGEMGTGAIQSGGGAGPELKSGLMSRLSEASGRSVIYNQIQQSAFAPERWKEHLARVEEACRKGVRALPLVSPTVVVQHFTMKNCQIFRQMPTWLSLINVADEEKLRAYADPATREKLRADLDLPDSGFYKRWDLVVVEEPHLPKNQALKGKNIAQIAAAQGREPFDVFVDLVVEEALNTRFAFGNRNTDRAAVGQLLRSPYTVVGLSDGGAHVQFHSEVGYSTQLLGYWVREQKIMSLEQAVRRLTFDPASAFGIYDRGLLRPGLAADIVVFDPATVNAGKEEAVHDLPNNGWRIRVLAEGIRCTIVNGEVLLENGEPSGAYPGRVLRNARYNALHDAV
ncbi:MAG TPA: amidohydrolase family protein [Candidatus Acidoferrales bacterium]|nr:amidohydrolase family protein [Candidatus Acidoferrales bacterium]